MESILIEESFGVICERTEKDLYVTGPFLVASVKNKNGRVYPPEVMENAVDRYAADYISKKASVGELNHPSSVTVNPERISHYITEIKRDGNIWSGKAKILDTPMGNIVRTIVNEGLQIGVSSRGLGSLVESNGSKVVQKGFTIRAIDIVQDPSGPGCYVQGVNEALEEADLIYENGEYRIKKSGNVLNNDDKLRLFKEFFAKLIA